MLRALVLLTIQWFYESQARMVSKVETMESPPAPIMAFIGVTSTLDELVKDESMGSKSTLRAFEQGFMVVNFVGKPGVEQQRKGIKRAEENATSVVTLDVVDDQFPIHEKNNQLWHYMVRHQVPSCTFLE
jgi:hypothetical protein